MRYPRIALLVALASLIVGVAAACGGGGDSAATPTPAPKYRGGVVEPPFEKPAVVLTDTTGRPYDLRKETDGYLTLFYVGYTHCPDICPTTMFDLSQVLQKLSPETRSQVKVVFVTADPERDTPPVIRTWLDMFDKTFVGLTGSAQQINALLFELGMNTPTKTDLGGGNYAVSHAAYVIAFTKDNTGRLAYPFGMTPAIWAHDLPLLVEEQWQ